jgi:hypothetical protein
MDFEKDYDNFSDSRGQKNFFARLFARDEFFRRAKANFTYRQRWDPQISA